MVNPGRGVEKDKTRREVEKRIGHRFVQVEAFGSFAVEDIVRALAEKETLGHTSRVVVLKGVLRRVLKLVRSCKRPWADRPFPRLGDGDAHSCRMRYVKVCRCRKGRDEVKQHMKAHRSYSWDAGA